MKRLAKILRPALGLLALVTLVVILIIQVKPVAAPSGSSAYPTPFDTFIVQTGYPYPQEGARIDAYPSPIIDSQKENSALLESDAGPVLSKDIEAYDAEENIDIDTAVQQLGFTSLAGALGAKLAREEAETYAGLYIQHSPIFRIIVLVTPEGKDAILPYLENEVFAEYVETRIVNYTLMELEAAQYAAQAAVQNLGIPTNSGINVKENRVELYVIDRSQFDEVLREHRIQLPPEVVVVTVSELATQD